jgi:hypothetical protein
MKDAISKANAALDQLGAQDLSKVSLKSTIAALDDLTYEASIAANKATITRRPITRKQMTPGSARTGIGVEKGNRLQILQKGNGKEVQDSQLE